MRRHALSTADGRNRLGAVASRTVPRHRRGRGPDLRGLLRPVLQMGVLDARRPDSVRTVPQSRTRPVPRLGSHSPRAPEEYISCVNQAVDRCYRNECGNCVRFPAGGLFPLVIRSPPDHGVSGSKPLRFHVGQEIVVERNASRAEGKGRSSSLPQTPPRDRLAESRQLTHRDSRYCTSAADRSPVFPSGGSEYSEKRALATGKTIGKSPARMVRSTTPGRAFAPDRDRFTRPCRSRPRPPRRRPW